MQRPGWSLTVLVLFTATRLHAQEPSIDAVNDLKAKVYDAQIAQQRFVKGAKFCSELNGATFYLAQQNRVLNLEEYHRALQNLAKVGAFNMETKRPWTDQDANARWEEAQKEAANDKINCELIASLPFLQKKLQELESKSQASEKRN